ncbi:hypothetical protein L2E82_39260 [Cichorium intybus]|uniref:Uncharacterized protein n=1 Tax=Cichorium intybus TaxID=13427 RepID=A0ACB9AI27_CICIN|nr:hypothetical protein L2E82_39260 [Cichorium intybus]
MPEERTGSVPETKPVQECADTHRGSATKTGRGTETEPVQEPHDTSNTHKGSRIGIGSSEKDTGEAHGRKRKASESLTLLALSKKVVPKYASGCSEDNPITL